MKPDIEKIELNLSQTAEYIRITKSGNMKDMFEFGVKMAKEALLTPEKDTDVANPALVVQGKSYTSKQEKSGITDGDVADNLTDETVAKLKEYFGRCGVFRTEPSVEQVANILNKHITQPADTKRDVIMDGREAAKALEIMIRKKAIAEAVKRHIHLDNCLICQWAKDNGVNPEQYLLESESDSGK